MAVPKFKVGDIVRTRIDGKNSKQCWFAFSKGTLLFVNKVSSIDFENETLFRYECEEVAKDKDVTQTICEEDLEFVCSTATASIVSNSVMSREAYRTLTASRCNSMSNPVPQLKVVDGLSIKNIDVNIYKRIVTVVFENGHVEQVHCAEGDAFDVRIGVAIAIASAKFGSKSKFHKFVDKVQKFVGKEPKAEPKKGAKSKSKKKSK